MTRHLAALLLGLAARRWPTGVREDMLAEWSAEVHALVSTDQHWRTLCFAASLAATRPRTPPFSLASTARHAWSGLWLVIVLPVAALAVGMLGGCFPPLAIAGAVLMALLGDKFVPRRMPVAVLIPAVTVPGCALYAMVYALGTTLSTKQHRHALAALVFCAGLTLTLVVVAPLVRSERRRWAWLAGITCALVAADLAVAVPYLGNAQLNAAGSPMWMVTAMTGTAFGLPHPNTEEIFIIRDNILLDPPVFLVLAGFALGTVIAAARAHPTPRPDRDVTGGR